MRWKQVTRGLAVLGCAGVLLTGCSATQPQQGKPELAKPQSPQYAVVDMQKLLDQHPKREELRKMEQKLAADQAKAQDKTALMETAQREFEAAMKVRQNEDRAALEKKQAQLREQLNEERRRYIGVLEEEYRPLLFNIELKLKTVQQTPTETQKLQQEKQRVEAEMQLKLKAKEEELANRFHKEMGDYVAELSRRSEAYAKKWQDDRLAEIQKPVSSPELEKDRQEIVQLSQKMIQEVRSAVGRVAEKEKIDIVWLKSAVKGSAKEITDLVAKELTTLK